MAEPNLQLIQNLLKRVPEGQRRTDDKHDRLIDDTADLKVRMTASEESTAGSNCRRSHQIAPRPDRTAPGSRRRAIAIEDHTEVSS
jgi:hypothetical protein